MNIMPSPPHTEREGHAERVPLCSFLASGLQHRDNQMAERPYEGHHQVAWEIKDRKYSSKV